MKRVYKYPLSPLRNFENSLHSCLLPEGAEIIAVRYLNARPVLFASVDTTAPYEERHFGVYGTGWDLPDEIRQYIGTISTGYGDFDWHVFELTALPS